MYQELIKAVVADMINAHIAIAVQNVGRERLSCCVYDLKLLDSAHRNYRSGEQ